MNPYPSRGFRIKLCGVRTVEDALLCAAVGADEIGVVFAPSSKRCISRDVAARIRDALPASIPMIGVFLDASATEVGAVRRAVELAAVQLHGRLDGSLLLGGSVPLADHPRIVAALHVDGAESLVNLSALAGCDRLLLDGPKGGGSGSAFDWALTARFRERFTGELFIAGGLTPENVAEAIRCARPDGVDVSSGIERPDGFKDPARARAFVERARRADAQECQEHA